MTDLSPAAQAVLSAAEDAYGYNYSEFYCCADRVAAAALRAVADQLTPYSVEDMPGAAFCRNKLLAITAELEAQ